MANSPYGSQLNQTDEASLQQAQNQGSTDNLQNNNTSANYNPPSTITPATTAPKTSDTGATNQPVTYGVQNNQKADTYNNLSGYNTMAKNLLNNYLGNSQSSNQPKLGQLQQAVQQQTNVATIAQTGLAADYTGQTLNLGNKAFNDPSQLTGIDTNFKDATLGTTSGVNKADYYGQDIANLQNQLANANWGITTTYDNAEGGRGTETDTSVRDAAIERLNGLNSTALQNYLNALNADAAAKQTNLSDLQNQINQANTDYGTRQSGVLTANQADTNQLATDYSGRLSGLQQYQNYLSGLQNTGISDTEAAAQNTNQALAGLNENDTIGALGALKQGYDAGRTGTVDALLERGNTGDVINAAKNINADTAQARAQKAVALSSYGKANAEASTAADTQRKTIEDKIAALTTSKAKDLETNYNTYSTKANALKSQAQSDLSSEQSQIAQLKDLQATVNNSNLPNEYKQHVLAAALSAPPEAVNDLLKAVHNKDYKTIPNIINNFAGKEIANGGKVALAPVTGGLSALDWGNVGSWGNGISNIGKKLGW
jgi:hypothetical protein